MSRFGWVRRRPRLGLLAVLLCCSAAGLAGLRLWAGGEYRAAEQAFRAEHKEEARRHIRRCLWAWPRRPAAHLLAARIARSAEDYARAEAHLRECQRLQGGASDATQLEWLLLRAQGGEADEVAPGLWYAVEQGHPERTMILAVLARAYMRTASFDAALRCLDRWLLEEPESARALDWRGWVMEKKQNEDEARRSYEQALDLEPGRHAVRRRLAQMLLGQNQAPDARAHLETLRAKGAEEPDDQLDWARLHLLEGDLDQARDELEEFLARHPDNPDALLSRGKLALTRSRPAEAEVYLRRAEKRAPADPGMLVLLERCLRQQPGRQREADRYLKRYQRAQADHKRLTRLLNQKGDQLLRDPRAAAEAGRLLLELGLTQPARYWLEAALKRDDKLPEVHQGLADYYRRLGNDLEAEHHRRLALGAESASAPWE
jgi:predicted Zn-dependent protease